MSISRRLSVLLAASAGAVVAPAVQAACSPPDSVFTSPGAAADYLWTHADFIGFVEIHNHPFPEPQTATPLAVYKGPGYSEFQIGPTPEIDSEGRVRVVLSGGADSLEGHDGEVVIAFLDFELGRWRVSECTDLIVRRMAPTQIIRELSRTHGLMAPDTD